MNRRVIMNLPLAGYAPSIEINIQCEISNPDSVDKIIATIELARAWLSEQKAKEASKK